MRRDSTATNATSDAKAVAAAGALVVALVHLAPVVTETPGVTQDVLPLTNEHEPLFKPTAPRVLHQPHFRLALSDPHVVQDEAPFEQAWSRSKIH